MSQSDPQAPEIDSAAEAAALLDGVRVAADVSLTGREHRQLQAVADYLGSLEAGE